MKDIWKEYEPNLGFKRINRKKIIITTIVVTVIVLVGIAVGTYCTNEAVRGWIDKFIFRKEVLQDSVATIDLKEGQNANVYAFNKYIGILDQAKFTVYSNSGSKEKELDVQISNPLYSSANRFLAIAEKGGQKFYLITDKDVSWDATVEGNISQVFVNKNGYVAVVITGTLNKTVIKMYNPSGKAMFTQYLSTTRAIDVSISNDNRYLAIAEIDTSKTVLQSNVKIISIEKAEKNADDYLEKTYSSATGKLITNIRYQDKNKLVCMYTDGISVIENDQENTLVDTKDKKIAFQSIDIDNNICYVEEKSSGLFTADSVVNITNIDNKSSKQYTVNYVAKEIFTNVDIIALNLGTDIEFINTGGWLVKRYVANQEITNVVVSNNIAGIVYRDKIEIINL
ncbi:MAG: hypothetical protein EGQ16_06305 [Clostridiales bacterium]|nr:hypothetical protein [Clostridiales bacterium]MBD9159422.1 hypothetical protein [Clostridiales bacterium]